MSSIKIIETSINANYIVPLKEQNTLVFSKNNNDEITMYLKVKNKIFKLYNALSSCVINFEINDSNAHYMEIINSITKENRRIDISANSYISFQYQGTAASYLFNVVYEEYIIYQLENLMSYEIRFF